MDIGGAQKEIDIGADVFGHDGRKLGTVSFVVVKPPEMHVTDIVVSTGGILGRDIVVPADRILDVVEGEVFLSVDKEQLDKFPDYIEIKYQKPPPGWVPPAHVPYTPAAVLLPPTASIPELETVRVNAPPGTLGIRDGMEVESIDGHKVGKIDGLDIDPDTEDITGFVVKHGFLFPHDTRIPVADVEKIRHGKVVLKLTKNQIQQVDWEQRQLQH